MTFGAVNDGGYCKLASFTVGYSNSGWPKYLQFMGAYSCY